MSHVYQFISLATGRTLYTFSSVALAERALIGAVDLWRAHGDAFPYADYAIQEVDLDLAEALPRPDQPLPGDVVTYWMCTFGTHAVHPRFTILIRPTDEPLPEPQWTLLSGHLFLGDSGIPCETHGYGATREDAEQAARSYFAELLQARRERGITPMVPARRRPTPEKRTP
jgi:hypothetical protein